MAPDGVAPLSPRDALDESGAASQDSHDLLCRRRCATFRPPTQPRRSRARGSPHNGHHKREEMSLFQKKEAMQKCRLSCVRTAASLYLSNTTGIVVCCCVVTLVRQETARPRWPRTRNGSIVCQTNVPPTRTRHPGPLFTASTNCTIKRSNNVTFFFTVGEVARHWLPTGAVPSWLGSVGLEAVRIAGDPISLLAGITLSS